MKSDIFKLLRENGNKKDEITIGKYLRNQFNFLGIRKPKLVSLIKPHLKKESSIDWDFINICWAQKEREFKYSAVYYISKNLCHIKANDLPKIKQLILIDSWWDTIDHFIGTFNSALLNDQVSSKKILLEWSTDQNFWVRRCSIISQILMKEKTDVDLLQKCIKNNLNQKEFFINKAIGWSLRDYSKTNPKWVNDFVEKNKKDLSHLSIREGTRLLKIIF